MLYRGPVLSFLYEAELDIILYILGQTNLGKKKLIKLNIELHVKKSKA